ncbi:hypothetical protein SAMN04489751_1677 [Brevibacterium sandarakinum]|uniref:Uncharacterized protein n=1 Tax=Brevibacterium sandarakinum TaxID=629680 RepID=A0A1H1R053_BRESA|nr:hypothetical protein SAMN04489751_1677 [Brevibacterium sandarakinum]
MLYQAFRLRESVLLVEAALFLAAFVAAEVSAALLLVAAAEAALVATLLVATEVSAALLLLAATLLVAAAEAALVAAFVTAEAATLLVAAEVSAALLAALFLAAFVAAEVSAALLLVAAEAAALLLVAAAEVLVALSVVFRHNSLLVDDVRPRPAAWLTVSNIKSLDTRGSKENCAKLAQVSEAVHFLAIFTGISEKTVAVNDVSTR